MDRQPDRQRAALPQAIAAWRSTDPVLAELGASHPPQAMAIPSQDGFASLCASIIHQQVSLAAGRTIYARFEQAVGQVAPGPVLAAGEVALRGAGLSRAKTAYVLDLAAQAAAIPWDGFDAMDDDAVIEMLTRVKGIGVWTAKMFLLFHLQRPDVSCPEDLGLRIAAARFYDVPADRAAALLREKAPAWSPYNSLANRVLWEARRAL